MSLLTVTTIEGLTLDVVPWQVVAIERARQPVGQPAGRLGCTLLVVFPGDIPGRSPRIGVQESRDVVVERWRGALMGWIAELAPIFRGITVTRAEAEPPAADAPPRRK